MDFIILATDLNWVGKIIYNGLYGWVQGWANDYTLIGAFGVTVILFTIFLKLITLPMDVWQKTLTRKNALKMEIMKPELDKLTKQCGENKELLMQKQRELYKKYKYSAFSACLPTILTLVIFFVVFSGFNSAVRYHNSVEFDRLSEVYDTTYDSAIDSEEAALLASSSEKMNFATEKAEAAVVAAYKSEKFLLTENIFMPDVPWKRPVPDVSTYSGTGIGKLGITDMTESQYNKVMKPIIEAYNTTPKGKGKPNGYLVLPVISFILSILSTKLVKPPEQPAIAGQTEEQIKAQKSQAKMMTYMMPILMGAFALFYSSAFTLYMVVGNIFTTVFNLIFNLVTKRIDDRKREERLSTTVK